MTRLLAFAAATAVLLSPLAARADAPNDPCMGLRPGDDCTTLDNKPGTCADTGGFLDCVENGGEGGGGRGGEGGGGRGGAGGGGRGGAGGGGNGGNGGAGGGATGGGQGATGNGGSSSGGESDDDGGCSMSHAPSTGAPAFAGLAAIAIGAFVARRRRNRSRA